MTPQITEYFSQIANYVEDCKHTETHSKIKKILIIDFNVPLTQRIQNYLKENGHDCTYVLNETNGLSLFENESFDTVILELEHLNLIEKLKGSKIIVWSTHDLSQPEIDYLLRKGAHSYLKKPVLPEVLLRIIEKEEKRQTDELKREFNEMGQEKIFLEEINKHLEKNEKISQDVFEQFSHELRTPIAVIKSYIDMILEGKFGTVPAEQHVKLIRVSENTDSLIQIIGQMLVKIKEQK